jgi:hypothetical protein
VPAWLVTAGLLVCSTGLLPVEQAASRSTTTALGAARVARTSTTVGTRARRTGGEIQPNPHGKLES